MSPRIKNLPGPYRIYFVSFDCHEPPHVHVLRERKRAKCWLEPVAMATNHGFSERELRRIERLIRDYHSQIMEAWA